MDAVQTAFNVALAGAKQNAGAHNKVLKNIFNSLGSADVADIQLALLSSLQNLLPKFSADPVIVRLMAFMVRFITAAPLGSLLLTLSLGPPYLCFPNLFQVDSNQHPSEHKNW